MGHLWFRSSIFSSFALGLLRGAIYKTGDKLELEKKLKLKPGGANFKN